MKKSLISVFMSIIMAIIILPSYSFSSVAETTGEVYRDFYYVDFGDGTAGITGYTGTDTVVEIPATINGCSVIEISFNAFLDCTTIEEFVFSENLQYIAGLAFQGCTSLKEITLPENLVYVGTDIFSGCTSLEKIYISENNSYFSTENGILYNKAKTNIHRFPIANSIKNYTMPETVKSMDKRAFFNCKYLETVVTSNNLTKINEDAFYGCPMLKSITLGNALQTIETYAFEACESLTNIIIPDTVTKIKKRAFCDCKSLKSVVIGNGVETIGQSAFQSCEALENITFGDSVIELGNYAFNYCSSLETINLPNSLTKLGISAFASCKALKNMVIPSGVTTIPNSLFAYCNLLESVTFPETVTSIGRQVFQNCYELKSVILPASLTRIGISNFSGTSLLTDVYYAGSKSQWDAISVDYTQNQYLQSATIHYNFTPFTGFKGDYFYENGVQQKAYQLVEFEGDFYFIGDHHQIIKNRKAYLTEERINGLTYEDGTPITVGSYNFDENGKMIVLNGFIGDNVYKNNTKLKAYQLVAINGDFYFIGDRHQIVKNKTVNLTEERIKGLTYADGTPITAGRYYFGDDGKMVMLDGLVGNHVYKNNVQIKAYQLVEINGDFYFVGDRHEIVKNRKVYLTEERIKGLTYADGTPIAVGSYNFDESGKMIIE